MKEIRRRYVKEFLDILILSLLEKNAMSGRDMIVRIHKNFDIFLASSTVYPLLHSMKERGLIRNTDNGKKKIYSMTKKGKSFAQKAHHLLRSIK